MARFRMGNMNDASNAGQQPDIRVQDAAYALGKHAGNASQWEAVAVDGKESVCMLSETHAEITCHGHRLRHAKGVFTLDVSGIPALDSAWKAQPNSRGEGMLLMKKGHVLVLKEKKPSLLIEFGPEGDQPVGYGPDTFLGPRVRNSPVWVGASVRLFTGQARWPPLGNSLRPAWLRSRRGNSPTGCMS